ncbi:MAG: response regulator [candidate division WOR-3 bacterium]
MKKKQAILLVEDDEVDIKSVERAFSDLRITNPLIVTHDGKEALNYLNNEKNKRPGLILLDIKMPRMNGIEFLRIVKRKDKLKIIPIVILTTSKEEKDKMESFNLGIAGYMMKPVNYKDFVEVIRTIKMYWTLSETP